MSELVPASTKVHRNRAHNVDTDRLLRRRTYLIDRLKNSGIHYERRLDFALQALELHAIENVLEDRQEITTRHTTRSYQP